MSEPRLLGTLVPLGGGDPIPLKKEEMIVGRRPSCAIRLDFENVSGKHCVLRFGHGTWHVRDLGSTNGTHVNGQRINSEHGVMPDDELKIATHLFRIDYEPASPILESQQLLEEEMNKSRKQTSLMELAGFYSDERPSRPKRATKAPDEPIKRPSAEEEDFDEELPSDFEIPPAPGPASDNDDDFLKMIEDDLRKSNP